MWVEGGAGVETCVLGVNQLVDCPPRLQTTAPQYGMRNVPGGLRVILEWGAMWSGQGRGRHVVLGRGRVGKKRAGARVERVCASRVEETGWVKATGNGGSG